jgi:hypothetical protein
MPYAYEEARQRKPTRASSERGDVGRDDSALTAAGKLSDGGGAIAGSPDTIIQDYIRKMAVDVLLQVVQELAGFGAGGEWSTVGQLLREVPQICRSAMSVEDKVNRLRNTFNNRREAVGKHSPLYGTLDALYKVSDVLFQISVFKPLTGQLIAGEKKASDLKEPLQHLLSILPAGAGISDAALLNLLECLDIYQELKGKNASNTEIIQTLVLEKLAPEQLSRPLGIAATLAEKIRAGELSVEGLPGWPQGDASDMNVAGARLAWLMDVLDVPAVEGKLDEVLSGEDAAFVRENLLVFVKAARQFPSEGTVFEKWEALQDLLRRVPVLSGLLSSIDMRLQPALGEYAEVLKDDASVMQLLGVVMSPETAYEKGRKLTGMIDYPGLATKGAREVGKAASKALHWGAQPVLLAGTKAWEYHKSAYRIEWTTAPRMIYASVRDYLKEDFQKNPRDYEQLLIGGDIPNRLMKVALATEQVEVPENATTAEYLEAYAAAGSKLSSKTEWAFQRWLEISMVFKISRAMRQGESHRAREDLEVMGRTLKRYAQDGMFAGLAPLADILPYIPAMKEAWDELALLNAEQREHMQLELAGRQETVQTMQGVISGAHEARPDEVQAMQETLAVMQQSLGSMQNDRGVQPDWSGLIQSELDAWRAVIAESMEGEAREGAQDELEAIQHSLGVVNHSLDQMPQSTQATPQGREHMLQIRRGHEAVQKGLEERLEAHGTQTALKVMERKLGTMLQQLARMPEGPALTDVRSLHDWLAQVLLRLARSKKPGIRHVVSELEQMVRDVLARNLCKLINQTQQAIISAFTKEIELTPEEIAEGWFVLDSEYSTGPMVAAMLGGATAGAGLAIGLPWLLGRLGAFRGGERARPSLGTTRTSEGEVTAMLGTPHAGPYASPTTEAVEGSSRGPGWKAPALGAAMGAGAGLLLTLLLNPPVVAKRRSDQEEAPDDPRLTRAGRLHQRDGKGIILSSDEAQQLFSPVQERGPDKKNREKRFLGLSTPIPVPLIIANEAQLVSMINDSLAEIHEGVRFSLEGKLDPVRFIRKYIQDILDAHPDGRENLVDPDCKLKFRTSLTGFVVGEHSLFDLAIGKFNYLDYNPIWSYQGSETDNAKLRFRKALLPDASIRMDRWGHNVMSKKSGRSLPGRVLDAYIEKVEQFKIVQDDGQGNG